MPRHEYTEAERDRALDKLMTNHAAEEAVSRNPDYRDVSLENLMAEHGEVVPVSRKTAERRLERLADEMGFESVKEMEEYWNIDDDDTSESAINTDPDLITQAMYERGNDHDQ